MLTVGKLVRVDSSWRDVTHGPRTQSFIPFSEVLAEPEAHSRDRPITMFLEVQNRPESPAPNSGSLHLLKQYHSIFFFHLVALGFKPTTRQPTPGVKPLPIQPVYRGRLNCDARWVSKQALRSAREHGALSPYMVNTWSPSQCADCPCNRLPSVRGLLQIIVNQ